MVKPRLEGRQPVAITHQAATMDQAVHGAANKLTRMIDSALGKQRDQLRTRTDPPPVGVMGIE